MRSALALFVPTLLFSSLLTHPRALASLPDGIVEVARISYRPPARGQWTPDGKAILYHQSEKDGQATILRFSLAEKKSQLLQRSINGYWPIPGPMETFFAGPLHDPPASLASWFRQRPAAKPAPKEKKNEKKDGDTDKEEKDNDTDKEEPPKPPPTPVDPKKEALAAEARQGIILASEQHKSYLFPGWRPRYSEAARRLVFSFQGILYLWDPLKDRKSGLLLLTRGEDPRWSLDGRAMLYNSRPFVRDRKGFVQDGGIAIVDMLFRALQIAPCGGDAAWAPHPHAIFFVASTSCLASLKTPPHENQKTKTNKPKKPKKTSTSKNDSKKKENPKKTLPFRGKPMIVMRSLKGTQEITTIAQEAWSPQSLPDTSTIFHPLLAYTDAKGVWLYHTQSRRRLLIAPKASAPRWSKQGLLLVHTPHEMKILRIQTPLLHKLAKNSP